MLYRLIFIIFAHLPVKLQANCECAGLETTDIENHCIELHEGFTSMIDAEESCLSRGGHLIHPDVLTNEILQYIKTQTGETPALIGLRMRTSPSIMAYAPCPSRLEPRMITDLEEFLDGNSTTSANCVYLIQSYQFFVFDTCSREMNAACDIPTVEKDVCGSLLCPTTSTEPPSTTEESTTSSDNTGTTEQTTVESTTSSDNTGTTEQTTVESTTSSDNTETTENTAVTDSSSTLTPTDSISTVDNQLSSSSSAETTETSENTIITTEAFPETVENTKPSIETTETIITDETSTDTSLSTAIPSTSSASVADTSITDSSETETTGSKVNEETETTTLSELSSSVRTIETRPTDTSSLASTQESTETSSITYTSDNTEIFQSSNQPTSTETKTVSAIDTSSDSTMLTPELSSQQTSTPVSTTSEKMTDPTLNTEGTTNMNEHTEEPSENTITLEWDELSSSESYSTEQLTTTPSDLDTDPVYSTDVTENSENTDEPTDDYYSDTDYPEYPDYSDYPDYYNYPDYSDYPEYSEMSSSDSNLISTLSGESTTESYDYTDFPLFSSDSQEVTTSFPSPIPSLSISSIGTTSSFNNEIPIIPNPGNPGSESSTNSPTSAKPTNTASNIFQDSTPIPKTTTTSFSSPISSSLSTELHESTISSSSLTLTSSTFSDIQYSSPNTQTSSITTKRGLTSSGTEFPITSLPTTSPSTNTSQFTTTSNSSKLVSSTPKSSTAALNSSSTTSQSDFSLISTTTSVIPTTKSSKRQCNKMEFRLFNMCMDWRFILGFCLLLILLNMICWCLVCLSRCATRKDPDVEASDDIPELPKDPELFNTPTDPADFSPPLPALPSQILLPYMPPPVNADVHIIENPICTENVSTQTDFPIGPMIFPVKPKKKLRPAPLPTPLDDDGVLGDDISINVPYSPDDEIQPKGDITVFFQNKEPGLDPEPPVPDIPFFVPMRAPRFPSPPTRDPPKKPPRFISPPKHPRQPHMDMPMQNLKEPNNVRDQAREIQKPQRLSPPKENGIQQHIFPSPPINRPPMVPPLINLTSENNEETPIIDDSTPPPPAPFSNNRNSSGFAAPSRNISQLFSNSPPQSVRIQRAKGRVGGVVRAGNPTGPAPTVWKPWSKPTDTFSSPKGDF